MLFAKYRASSQAGVYHRLMAVPTCANVENEAG